MRITNIQNRVIWCNNALNNAFAEQFFRGAKASYGKMKNNETPSACCTSGTCFDFNTAKAYYMLKLSKITKPQYIVPEEYKPVVKKSEEILELVPFVLDKFNEAYFYAENIIHKAEVLCDTTELPKAGREFIEELDDGNKLKNKVIFDRNGKLKLIKDYKNNSVILFDNSKNGAGKKYTLFINCKDIDNSESITAEESFTFKSGLPYCYAAFCKAGIDTDRFIADRVFNFRNHTFKSYDEILTVAAGTEYSKEYYEFESYAENLFDFDPMKCNFKRFVSGKVSADDKIYYSSDDFLISQCKRLKD